MSGTDHLPPRLARNPLALALCAAPEAREFPFEDERWMAVLETGARLLDALWISCGLWFLALLVVGLRTVHDWTWARALAASTWKSCIR